LWVIYSVARITPELFSVEAATNLKSIGIWINTVKNYGSLNGN